MAKTSSVLADAAVIAAMVVGILATVGTVVAGDRPRAALAHAELTRQIAAQGNQAVRSIQADARAAARQQARIEMPVVRETVDVAQR